ncbi:MAG TPA: PGPGW domain-containing protein [Bryobacteraceae bacterium]|nr:PGPGW domain-containing protein [Bryobacteraceae bacterium]
MRQTSDTAGSGRISKRARIWNGARIVAGFIVIIVGLLLSLPGIPGPGLAIAVLGLAMLAPHFEWAQRLQDWGKRKLEQAKARVRNRRKTPGA